MNRTAPLVEFCLGRAIDSDCGYRESRGSDIDVDVAVGKTADAGPQGRSRRVRVPWPGWCSCNAHRYNFAVREYLRTPSLGLRLVNLPGYSPDFNADEAIWGWAREQATGNLCLGSRAAVQERAGSFLARLTSRKDEVKRRCRTVLQARAESLLRYSQPDPRLPANAHLTLALV